MPFREWIHSGGSNLEEMENGGEEEGTVNDTDLCRGRVANRGTRRAPFVQLPETGRTF